jgi:hypothetical protein
MCVQMYLCTFLSFQETISRKKITASDFSTKRFSLSLYPLFFVSHSDNYQLIVNKMGTSCSQCVGGDDVKTLSHHHSSFDPSQQRSRSVFSHPSSQDDFLKKQREERKRTNTRQQRDARFSKTVKANRVQEDITVASPLFKKKDFPAATAATVTNDDTAPSNAQPSEPSIDGHSSSGNEHPPGADLVRVANALGEYVTTVASTPVVTTNNKLAPRKSRKQNLFFMPES